MLKYAVLFLSASACFAAPKLVLVVLSEDKAVYADKFKSPDVAVVTSDVWDTDEIAGLSVCCKPRGAPVAVRVGQPVAVPFSISDSVEAIEASIDASLVIRRQAEEDSVRTQAVRDSHRKQLENGVVRLHAKLRRLSGASCAVDNTAILSPADLVKVFRDVPQEKASEALNVLAELMVADYYMRQTNDAYWWEKLSWFPDEP